MSNNIADTDIDLIRKEIFELITILKQIPRLSEEREYELSKQFSHLYNTSKTLFKFIINNANSKTTPNHNQNFFIKTIDLMLNKISDIQKGKLSQLEASSIIGTHVAKEYIDVCK